MIWGEKEGGFKGIFKKFVFKVFTVKQSLFCGSPSLFDWMTSHLVSEDNTFRKTCQNSILSLKIKQFNM